MDFRQKARLAAALTTLRGGFPTAPSVDAWNRAVEIVTEFEGKDVAAAIAIGERTLVRAASRASRAANRAVGSFGQLLLAVLSAAPAGTWAARAAARWADLKAGLDARAVAAKAALRALVAARVAACGLVNDVVTAPAVARRSPIFRVLEVLVAEMQSVFGLELV